MMPLAPPPDARSLEIAHSFTSRATSSQCLSVRRGLSLLEVIVALAILAASAAILGQMLDLATRHMDRALEISDAQTVANNLMSDLLCGNLPLLGSETFQPVDAWSPWEYRVRVEPVGLGQLTALQVTVVKRAESATGSFDAPTDAPPATPTSLPVNAAGSDDFGGRPHYHLTRWARRAPPSDPNSLEGVPVDDGVGTRSQTSASPAFP
jgi:prepilin-type N-terminal cleavage/methylation domain-containing protein